jgi:multiple sugar transport system permease protein
VLKAFWNSTVVSVLSTLLVLALALPAGYGYSRFRFRGRDTTAFILLATRMFPPVVIVPGVFGILRTTGMYDTPWVLVLLYSSFTLSLSTWMMKAFFDDVPIHIEEAAMVDGFGRVGAFTLVTLPIAAPGIVATSIFTFILSWNEFFFAFMFTSERAKTAPVEFVGIFLRESGIQWHLMAAGACLLMVPTLSLAWVIQKYFVKGLGLGAVKG